MEELNELIRSVSRSHSTLLVVIVGPPESGKSAIADLFRGIHIPRPTITDGFIDHWNDTPCCKIIDTAEAMTDNTVKVLSSLLLHRLRTRHMYADESPIVPSSVVVTMSPEQYQYYQEIMFHHYYVGLGGLVPVIRVVNTGSRFTTEN
jgi:hypothetical protein